MHILQCVFKISAQLPNSDFKLTWKQTSSFLPPSASSFWARVFPRARVPPLSISCPVDCGRAWGLCWVTGAGDTYKVLTGWPQAVVRAGVRQPLSHHSCWAQCWAADIALGPDHRPQTPDPGPKAPGELSLPEAQVTGRRAVSEECGPGSAAPCSEPWGLSQPSASWPTPESSAPLGACPWAH